MEQSETENKSWDYPGPNPSGVYSLAEQIKEGDSTVSEHLAKRTAATRLLNVHLKHYMELTRQPNFSEIATSLPERTEGEIEDYLKRLTPNQQEIYLFETSIKGEMEILKIHLR